MNATAERILTAITNGHRYNAIRYIMCGTNATSKEATDLFDVIKKHKLDKGAVMIRLTGLKSRGRNSIQTDKPSCLLSMEDLNLETIKRLQAKAGMEYPELDETADREEYLTAIIDVAATEIKSLEDNAVPRPIYDMLLADKRRLETVAKTGSSVIISLGDRIEALEADLECWKESASEWKKTAYHFGGLAHARADANKKLPNLVESLRESRNKLRKAVAKKNGDRNALVEVVKNFLAEIIDQKNRLETKLEEMTRRRDWHSEQRQELAKNANTLLEDKHRLGKDVETLREQIRDWTEAAQEYKAQMITREDERNQLLTEKSVLETQLAGDCEVIEALKKDVDEWVAEVASAETNVEYWNELAVIRHETIRDLRLQLAKETS